MFRRDTRPALAQHLIIACVVLLLWWFFGLVGLIWLNLAYIAATFLSNLIIRSLPQEVGLLGAAFVVFGLGFDLVVWDVGLIFLWAQDEAVLRLFALAGLLMLMIHFTTRLSDDPLYRIAAVIVVVLGMLGLSAASLLLLGDPTEALLILLLSLICAGYTLWAIRKMEVERRAAMTAHASQQQLLREQALGRLTGGVAHQFNNLLTAVLGNLELAREVPDTEERKQVLQDAELAATRAAQISTQLMISARRGNLRPRRIDYAAFLDRLRHAVQRLVPETHPLEIAIADDAPQVAMDEHALSAVLTALCLNGMEAMPAGGAISIGFGRHAITSGSQQGGATTLPVGDYLAIVVTDEGDGIAADLLAHVSEPYFSTKPRSEGAGLGLSAAKGFAEQMGGGMDICSTPGGGTSVTLMIPVDPADGATSATPAGT